MERQARKAKWHIRVHTAGLCEWKGQRISTEHNKHILILNIGEQKAKETKKFLRKKPAKGLALSDNKAYYKVSNKMKVWYLKRGKHIGQCKTQVGPKPDWFPDRKLVGWLAEQWD